MRLRSGWAYLVLLLALGGAACVDRSSLVSERYVRKRVAAAARQVAEIEARQHTGPASLSAEEVITLGYLERLRLGLGSPFRLMEHARQDPRLSPGARTTVAWALLRATTRGEGYEVDPGALTGIGVDSLGRTPAAGGMHLELIRSAVRRPADPRVGELAVRLAYGMAAAEHVVGPEAPFLAAAAAALARDRALAQGDAVRVLAHAGETGRHPFRLVAAWRTERRMKVEAPTAAPRSGEVETAAAEMAAALLDDVRGIAGDLRAGEPVPWPQAIRPGLAPEVARRLGALAREGDPPPHAPVRTTLDRFRPDLLREADRTGQRDGMERFLRDVRTEEGFAAGYALLAVGGPHQPVLARVALETAVALRPFAQERVWQPGLPAPTAAELTRRFGIAAVEFDPEVPRGWHPYYRHVLADALADLRQALPGLDLRGARFRFGRTGKEGSALAIHDPYGRVVVLPPESGSGAIAHEVAHDLDWQAALRRYRRRAAYATDLAVHHGLVDRIAAAAQRLPESPVPNLRADTAAQRRYARRPAETFARSVDGYVVSMLAQRGRSNGALSSAQDDVLAGYGFSLLPDRRAETVEALLPLLAELSPLPEATRREYLRLRGPERLRDVHDLLVETLGEEGRRRPPRAAAAGPPSPQAVAAHGAAVRREAEHALGERDRVLRAWADARCAYPLRAHGAAGDAAVRRLVSAAAEARVRGIVLRHARALGFAEVPEWLRREWTREAAPSPAGNGRAPRSGWAWPDGTGRAGGPGAPCGPLRMEV